MSFKRTFAFPRTYAAATKAAKTLGFYASDVTATGTWRSLQPINGEYVDFEGPFAVKAGVGPAFVRDDGTEVFMLNDTSLLSVTFEEDA